MTTGTTADQDHRVCVVIPCYCESGRIGPFLESLCAECAALGQVSIQVVDDGSGAGENARMRALLEPLRGRHMFVQELMELPENVGKGGTVYAGWDAEKEARWLMFVDADGSVPAAEVARIIRLARTENLAERAYFASRVKMLGREVERVWLRDVIAHVFHWMVDLLLELRAHDTQCGCKLVPRATFGRARTMLTLTGFAFDVELLVALLKHGCEVVEVPVDWHETPGGKVRLLRDSWQMLRDVLHIRRTR